VLAGPGSNVQAIGCVTQQWTRNENSSWNSSGPDHFK
jgi:hypothetical protein